MKYLRYLALVAALLVPLSYSQAAVRVGIGIGVGPGYVAGPPVCPYGYYSDYPYSCAPYGYYSSTWFVNGIFIGSSNEIGAFESGVAARLMGTIPSVIFGGAMTLIVVGLTALFSPKLRKLRELA